MRCSGIFTNMIDGIQGLRPDTDTSAWVSLHSSKSTLMTERIYEYWMRAVLMVRQPRTVKCG